MAEIASGSIDLKSLKVAGEPNKYITYIDSDNGIRVYDGTLLNGTQVNFVKINSDGMQIYKGGSNIANKVAEFGSTITIGNESNNLFNIKITDQAISNRGPGILLRKGSQVLNEINTNGMNLYGDNNNLLLKINGSELTYKSINSDNIITLQRLDNTKYYLTRNLGFPQGLATIYTTDDSMVVSGLDNITNNTAFVLVGIYFTKRSSTIRWNLGSVFKIVYIKGTSEEKTLSHSSAQLVISYDGNKTFNFSVINTEDRQLGYSSSISVVPLYSQPSYGHIGVSYNNLIKGNNSFSFNSGIAIGDNSFAVNDGETLGIYSFAGGTSSAIGYGSAALGADNLTLGDYSFVTGRENQVLYDYGFAEGYFLKTGCSGQVVFGRYNVVDSHAMFVIGNGTETVASNAFTVSSSGDTWCAGSYTNGSDKRLKTHVNYLNKDAIKFIQELKPAHFIKNNEHHTGFYAQDIQKIDPWGGLIGQDSNEYLTLCYTDIIAPLVTYCQHLEKEIEELKKEIQEFKK